MARISPVEAGHVTGKAGDLLGGVKKKYGRVPNILGTMAHSPATLEAYFGFSGALGKGALPAKLREQIALVVGETNGCNYCIAAHSAAGKAAGLSEEDIDDSRRGISSDGKVDAALRFARQLVEKRGWVSDDDLAEVRTAGYGDAEITEIVANVGLNLFTNYFNHVANTEVDFPAARELVNR